MKFDFYQSVTDFDLRMVVKAGERLPRNVEPTEWKPMDVDTAELAAFRDTIAEEIRTHGFSSYKLVLCP